MRFLIDTHIFIGLINEEENFSKRVINTIEDSKNEIFLSIGSLWEIVIKVNIGKLTVTRNIAEMYNVFGHFGISVLHIQNNHLDHYLTLPLIHKDPFDRIIISQAIADDLILITDDQHIKNYPNLKLF